ncbi:hypothetical protein Bca52824_025175 [Brassica carinata]|uniref:Uncharacterized protein n=1 Tax=Brassica carinata TaxID=52824 RepID=A0A8X7VM60_BRACI|nr:hypothetical protein Bca52824_025175 [Brassica carinata]
MSCFGDAAGWFQETAKGGKGTKAKKSTLSKESQPLELKTEKGSYIKLRKREYPCLMRKNELKNLWRVW